MYLSPRLGLLSADTWALVAIYLRNLMLNWLVLLPLLMVVMLLPRFLLLVAMSASHAWDQAVRWCLVVGVLFQIVAFVCGHLMTPEWPRFTGLKTQKCYMALVWLPQLVAAMAFAAFWAGLHQRTIKSPESFQYIRDCFPGCASWLSWALAPWVSPSTSLATIDPHTRLFLFIQFAEELYIGSLALAHVIHLVCQGRYPFGWRALLGMGATLAVSAAFGGWLLWLIAGRVCLDPVAHPGSPPIPGSPVAYTILAVPAYLMSLLLAVVLARGLSSGISTDSDREWSARASGLLMAAGTGWVVMTLLVLLGPTLVLASGPAIKSAVAVAGGLSGIVTLVLSYSAKTPASAEGALRLGTEGLIRQVALAVVAPVFSVLLLVLLALVTDVLLVGTYRGTQGPLHVPPRVRLNQLSQHAAGPPADDSIGHRVFGTPLDQRFDWHSHVLVDIGHGVLLLWTGILIAVMVVMGLCVNINKFSLHTVYRNRLIRAYLGASRSNRGDPSGDPKYVPFTDFSDDDNFCLLRLNSRPFHVLNATLNLVAGHNLAWQQRKAASFTFTRLHCGSSLVGYRKSEHYAKTKSENAMTLGGAMAVSGAAANPNMGYHSSTVLTFLMTLFNVRLGVWLGNPGPAGDHALWATYDRGSPRMANRPLYSEAFGLTDETHPYVNISDGGHFEDLAIYEMVRRRCRFILAVDAGADPDTGFEDLGNAVRKILIDMGIPIEFEGKLQILGRDPQLKRVGRYAAVGTIRYSAVDGSDSDLDGKLVYIKPAFYGTEPMDVYNYAMGSPTFPHETTADQFFTESQFESYRKLGYYIMNSLLAPCQNACELDQIWIGACEHLGLSGQNV